MTTTNTDGPDLMSPELLADPHGGYRRLREQAPVSAGRYLGGSPAWYVTRFADVRAVLTDHRFVNNPASVPGVGANRAQVEAMEQMGVTAELMPYLVGSILTSDPPEHARLRRLVSRTFTVRRVGELRPRVEAITEGLLDDLAAAGPGPVDLVECFAYPLPITVICELVGIPDEDRASWREWGSAAVSMQPERLGPALRELVDYTHALVQRRRAEPSGDLLSGLVRARDSGGDQLSDVEIVTLVFTLVLAGHETTAHLIGNGTVALLARPDQLAVVRADPGRWPLAVHELMRWCGPVHLTELRYAAEDVELAGTLIRAGEAVQPVLVSANFDPRVYDDPERLDLTRQPAGRGDGHLGFGHGAHYCLGAALARQEGEVALSALFERFPDLALAVDESSLARQPLPGSWRLAELPVTL